jgi:glycosidase
MTLFDLRSCARATQALALLALGACAMSASGSAPPDPPPAAATADPPEAPVMSETPAAPAPATAAEPFSVWRHREPIYELYVRHFSPAGNFKGVEARLPELKALGIGIVWLLPVHEIGSITPANGGEGIDAPHGNPYAVKSFERVNPEYGSDGTEASAEADLKSLVARAHQLGMHVILDWVPNHTAWDNPLMTQHPDWYVRDGAGVRPVGPEFKWIAQLDWSKPALRAYMSDVMTSWTKKFDLDGFRVDFAHAMPISFFQDLRASLERVKPVFLLAEAGEPRFQPAFDMTYDWSVYPLFGDVARGDKPATALDDALLHQQLIPFASTPGALVMRMTYNHDDNGKFTLGDRYRGGIKTFAVLACTLPGKPLIFDGQEVGMNVFDGASVKPSINLGHDPKVKIDWTDADGYRPFYTKLLQLFRANPALHHAGSDDFRKLHTSRDDRVYAFVRRHGADTVVVVVNLSAEDLSSVTLDPTPNAGSWAGDYTELFSGAATRLVAGGGVSLPPWAYRVYVHGPTGAPPP